MSEIFFCKKTLLVNDVFYAADAPGVIEMCSVQWHAVGNQHSEECTMPAKCQRCGFLYSDLCK